MHAVIRSPINFGVTLFGASAIALTTVAAPPQAIHVPDLRLALSMRTVLENPIDVFAPILQQTSSDVQTLTTNEINNPAPILQAVLSNQTNNVFNVVNGFSNAGIALGDGAFTAPAALATAAQQVLNGNFAGALATLQNATLVPLSTAATGVVQTIQGVIQNQLDIASRLVVAVPAAATRIVGATVNAVTQIVLATGQAGLGVVQAVTTLSPVNVANSITDGVANVVSVAEQTTIGQTAFFASSAATVAPAAIAVRSASIAGAILAGRRQIANAIFPSRLALGVTADSTAAPLAAVKTTAAVVSTSTTSADPKAGPVKRAVARTGVKTASSDLRTVHRASRTSK